MTVTNLSKTNCLIIGFGSIGKRHAGILNKHAREIMIVTRYSNFDYPSVNNLSDLYDTINHFQYAIIATSTENHYVTLVKLLEAGFTGNILIEKPLFEKHRSIVGFPEANIYVGYNLRFHPALRELKSRLQDQTILSAQIYCGSYLPSWRPGRDYRSINSSSSKYSGGVARELSHELDYATWLLGDIKKYFVIHGKVSSLDIQADDLLVIVASMQNCPAMSLQLNFFDRAALREIRVITDLSTFVVDLINNTFRENDNEISYNIDRGFTYLSMHKAAIEDNAGMACTLRQATKILKLIAELESTEQLSVNANP